MKPLFFLLKHSRGRRLIYSLLQSLILFFTMVGCSTETIDEPIITQTKGAVGTDEHTIPYSDSQMEFGDPLPDVHSVTAMREAYRQLYPNGDGQHGPNAIKTTHLYVRFLPKSDEEYKSIQHYDLSDIPLHRKIVKTGSSYHDPDIPSDQYSGQYATVRVGNLNTNVEYEVIKELYLPDEMSDNGGVGMPGAAGPSGGGESMSFWETLEAASERIANGETTTQNVSDGLRGAPGKAKWYPHGSVKAYDDMLKRYIPISGAHIFVWHNEVRKGEAYADENGNFQVGKGFKEGYGLMYRCKWSSRNDFVIFDGGGMSEAFCSGGMLWSDTWNLDIPEHEHVQKHFAAMFRAGTRVYYKDYLGMAQPDPNGRLSMRYVDGPANVYGSFQYGFQLTNLRPDIKIYGWGKPNELRSSYDVFSTTSHELGHANHFHSMNVIKGLQYNKVDNKICESWAVAVQYYITKLEYLDYKKNIDSYASLAPDYSGMPGQSRLKSVYDNPSGMPGMPGSRTFLVPNERNTQYWPYTGTGLSKIDTTRLAYSSLIIDLIDDNNQREYFKRMKTPGYAKMPNDNVKGFTLAEIQGVLADSKSIEDFNTKIKELNTLLHPTLNTNAQIDNLFNGHKKYW